MADMHELAGSGEGSEIEQRMQQRMPMRAEWPELLGIEAESARGITPLK